MVKTLLAASLLLAPQIALAQDTNTSRPAMNAPAQEITSKRVEEGQQVMFRVVDDVVEGNKVVIRRGSPVTGTITWKTGRAIGGKSGKFEVTFNSVKVDGRNVALTGMHRQEGRGNSVGALLGSMVISGRSAVMLPGDLVNVFTGQDFVYY